MDVSRSRRLARALWAAGAVALLCSGIASAKATEKHRINITIEFGSRVGQEKPSDVHGDLRSAPKCIKKENDPYKSFRKVQVFLVKPGDDKLVAVGRTGSGPLAEDFANWGAEFNVKPGSYYAVVPKVTLKGSKTVVCQKGRSRTIKYAG